MFGKILIALSLFVWMGVGLLGQQAHAQAPAEPAGAASAALSAPVTATSALGPSVVSPVLEDKVMPVAAAPAPVPLTQPGRVGTETLNGADTAWMMTSTALVLLMTLPGIALFYGGMVRRKNVLNVMACVVAICAIVSLLWFAVGY
jgi:ammonium transporter, Amt family